MEFVLGVGVCVVVIILSIMFMRKAERVRDEIGTFPLYEDKDDDEWGSTHGNGKYRD